MAGFPLPNLWEIFVRFFEGSGVSYMQVDGVVGGVMGWFNGIRDFGRLIFIGVIIRLVG